MIVVVGATDAVDRAPERKGTYRRCADCLLAQRRESMGEMQHQLWREEVCVIERAAAGVGEPGCVGGKVGSTVMGREDRFVSMCAGVWLWSGKRRKCETVCRKGAKRNGS